MYPVNAILSCDNNSSGPHRESNPRFQRWKVAVVPKTPNLLQYGSTATYYGRVKVGGKIIRHSLETDVWTVAKLRLVDFLKDKQQICKPATECLTCAEAVALHE